ncbi:MAG: Trk system potassium transporter TrkA [Solirubrobacteraceae bacterium]
MKVVIVGAGHIGRTLVDALRAEHEVTVIDLDGARLAALSYRYDVHTVQGSGASRRVLQETGVTRADLVVATTARDEANLVAAMLVKRLSGARTIVRTSNVEYLEAWREREIDVNFMVSSELETANAVAGHVGLPAARQTDVFADGRVQVVEFDVPAGVPHGELIGRPLREAALPGDSKVASIIRGDGMVFPSGNAAIEAGDRIVIISSPQAAREWSRRLALRSGLVDDVVIYGAGRIGSAIARVLLHREVRVRLVETSEERAREAAEALPDAEVFHTAGFDPEFLERVRLGQAGATVLCMNDDARNLYGAIVAKLQGVQLTIGVVDDPMSAAVFERGGVDVTINPREVTAEEMVRFAHDPRIRQVAMLEGDRFEILDLTVREDSELANRSFRELPETGSVIGAVIRDGAAIFPHSRDTLRPGDRVIVFVEARRASLVERVL